MGLLFIPRVIYEHGEPKWNDDADIGKHLTHPPELWQSYHQTSGSKQEECAKGMRIQPCKIFLFILANYFLHAIKSYDMGPPAFLPLQRKGCSRFSLPLRLNNLGWV
jgi:hypothetical protein